MANGATGKVWTQEAILCAIHKWVNEYGEPPTSKVWASPHRPEGYPCTPTVRAAFGTWNDAIKKAGYRPRSRGVTGHIDPEYTIERFVGAARARAQG